MSDPLPTPSATVLDPIAAASAIGGDSAPAGVAAASPVASAEASPSAAAEPGPVAPGTLDKRGVPFDPARHLPKMHARHGGWMPRPQKGVPKRKPGVVVSPSPASPAAKLPPPCFIGGPDQEPLTSEEVQAINEIRPPVQIPPPGVEPSPWSEAERSAAAAGGDTPGAPGSGEGAAAAPATSADAEASPDALAEVVCNAVYTITGIFTGHMKDARPAAAEHAGIKRTVAAYLSARGWKAVGGLAVAATAAAYFIGVFQKDGPAGVLRAWWERRKAGRAKPVSPVAPPRADEPERAATPAAAVVVGDSAAHNFGL